MWKFKIVYPFPCLLTNNKIKCTYVQNIPEGLQDGGIGRERNDSPVKDGLIKVEIL